MLRLEVLPSTFPPPSHLRVATVGDKECKLRSNAGGIDLSLGGWGRLAWNTQEEEALCQPLHVLELLSLNCVATAGRHTALLNPLNSAMLLLHCTAESGGDSQGPIQHSATADSRTTIYSTSDVPVLLMY